MLSIRRAAVAESSLAARNDSGVRHVREVAGGVTITEAMLTRDGFGAHPRFRTLIAEWNRAAAGYAICFPIYSTFQGPALCLEDVYVRRNSAIKGSERR